MKHFTSLFLYLTILIFTIACGHKGKDAADKIIHDARWTMLDVACINRDFNKVRLYADTLLTYHQYHTLYYVKGWAYDMEGKTKDAQKYYMKAFNVLDKDIKKEKDKKKRDGHYANRAFMIYVLYGKEAFLKTIDSVKNVMSDTTTLDILRGLNYKKEDMFYGKAYKDKEEKWHCWYLQPGDTTSIEKLKLQDSINDLFKKGYKEVITKRTDNGRYTISKVR